MRYIKTTLHDKDRQSYLLILREKLQTYYPVSDEAWENFKEICSFKIVQKEDMLLQLGDISKEFYFICKGLLRTYFLDEQGNVYNKNLFLENEFSGSKVSMILNTPSEFCIEALETSFVICINFQKYKKLMQKHDDLKDMYISYLEKNWIIEKEKKEISLILEDASQRYQTYLLQYPDIEKRVKQHHIAAHLGITPTQLSRIRSKLNLS